MSEKLSKDESERLQIEYSFQDSKTDSIALLDNRTILRDIEVKLNLENRVTEHLLIIFKRFKADLVFIKTVDNIKPNDQEIC